MITLQLYINNELVEEIQCCAPMGKASQEIKSRFKERLANSNWVLVQVLQSRMNKRAGRPRVPEHIQAQIQSLLKQGDSHREVARKVELPPKTIGNIMKRVREAA